jgi:hypothetical protein
MKTLTELMLKRQPFSRTPDELFQLGAQRADRELRRKAWNAWEHTRSRYGRKGHPALLTLGDHNAKLAKAQKWTVGLTLQHYVQKLSTGLTLNACPNAGHCTKVCVLDNGNGVFPKVQVARRAKTEFFALHPLQAAFLLGWELADEVERHGSILFRPNVNSDVEWEKVLPSLTSGEVFGDAVISYGYSKLDYVLDTNGWLDSHYRVAYSWNEKSDQAKVASFLARGGSVALVTDRRKGGPPPARHGLVPFATVVDADLTDEWIFGDRVIGDLSAKGKARSLIGKSNFIVRSAV